YEAMTVAELQDVARRKGIENRSEKNKQQLISALLGA
ncbi:MAG: Rho termination factor, partial [Nitriliruptorales bacterium]|nr:Rho termination factor [Nitriliruptorales bacterium]